MLLCIGKRCYTYIASKAAHVEKLTPRILVRTNSCYCPLYLGLQCKKLHDSAFRRETLAIAVPEASLINLKRITGQHRMRCEGHRGYARSMKRNTAEISDIVPCTPGHGERGHLLTYGTVRIANQSYQGNTTSLSQ